MPRTFIYLPATQIDKENKRRNRTIVWLYNKARQLPIAINGVGDCLQVCYDPSGIRGCGNETFIIRKITLNRFRIWRKK